MDDKANAYLKHNTAKHIVTVATSQMACSTDTDVNINNAEILVRNAHKQGAQIILLQELFENLYFCQEENPDFFNLATTIENNKAVNHFKKIAKELAVVLPISFFEMKNNAYYNSVAVIDANGEVLGIYRKTHIPDGPGYEEKYYFNPGDTGFKVFTTRYAKIGLAICWDQWFPEAARSLALLGADLIFYPSAIGSEPLNNAQDSKNHWQMCMRGHAACNITPVIASNRIGTETFKNSSITFYGSSFIAGGEGELLAEASRDKSEIISASIDLTAMKNKRAAWGLFRDRRPEMYHNLMTVDGITTARMV